MTHKHLPVVQPRPYLMRNQVQHYEWGTRGDDAYIPQLLGITPQLGKPYAEIWMGAHTKAPSYLIVDGKEIALDQWIAAYPDQLLGTAVIERFGNVLPFLFKVLAAGEALSIQAHPNKAQARILHAKDPAHYPDDNHKPEVAIALDELTALMGIKPYDQLMDTLMRYPEIADFIDIDPLKLASTDSANAIRVLFTALFTRSTSHAQELNHAIDALADRLNVQQTRLTEAEHLFLDLRRKYTGADVGLFCIFLLNLVHLKQGQGMYAEAGIPHAYLKGNVIECMANSDNVVRVGLTPKFKDAPALLDILLYEPMPVTILGGFTKEAEIIYATPAPEFRVTRVRLNPSQSYANLTDGKPQILLITQGEIRLTWTDASATYQRGQSVYIPACMPAYSITADSSVECYITDIPI